MAKKKFKFTAAQERWLKALESGKYKKGYNRLHNITNNGKSHTYCCLGVACAVTSVELNVGKTGSSVRYNACSTELPGAVRDELRLLYTTGYFASAAFKVADPMHGVNAVTIASSLMVLNDRARWSHKKIAAWIRAHPKQVFKPCA